MARLLSTAHCITSKEDPWYAASAGQWLDIIDIIGTDWNFFPESCIFSKLRTRTVPGLHGWESKLGEKIWITLGGPQVTGPMQGFWAPK